MRAAERRAEGVGVEERSGPVMRRVLDPRGTASQAKSDSCGGKQYCQHALHDFVMSLERNIPFHRPRNTHVKAGLSTKSYQRD